MPRDIAQLSLNEFQSSPGSKIVRPHVRVGLTLYPQGSDPVISRKTDKIVCNWDKKKTQGTVKSFSFSKRLGEAAGKWMSVIKLDKQSQIDIPNGDVLGGDWADGSILRNGVVWPIFRGIVDSVRQKTMSVDGATVREFHVSGRDHGAIFESMIAWNNIFVQDLSQLIKGMFTERVKWHVGGSPERMFQILIEGAFGGETESTHSAWTLPTDLQKSADARRFFDALTINAAEKLRGAYFNEPMLWTQAGQNLHQTLGQWCNPFLNEFFYDLINLSSGGAAPLESAGPLFQMEATIRERPFVNTIDGMNSPWYSLPEWKIPSWLITSSDLGRSNFERFTIIEVFADFGWGNPGEQAALAPPRWSKNGVEFHGIKPYITSSKYMATSTDDVGSWVEERKIWQQLIADWFAPNPYFLSGTIEFGTMFPEIKIGSRLRLDTGDPKKPFIAYIEGVDHVFSFSATGDAGPSAKTILTVTRGFKGTDEELLSLVKNASSSFEEILDSRPQTGAGSGFAIVRLPEPI